MPDTTFLGAWIPKLKCWQVWFPLRSLSYAWASLVPQLVKNLPSMQETWVQSPGLGRSPEEGNNYRLQYSSLENSMDYIVHGGVTKSLTWLNNFHFLFTPMLTDYCPPAASSCIVSSVYRSSWHLLLFFQGQPGRLASVPTLMFHFNLITFSYIQGPWSWEWNTWIWT